MVRNVSVARIIMWLCFGTAILSLAVHWRLTTTEQKFEQIGSKQDSDRQDSASGMRGSALGASVPGKISHRASTSKTSASKFHHTQSGTASKNVAPTDDEPQKTPLVVQTAQIQNPTVLDWPQSLVPKASAQQKTANKLAFDQRQVVIDLSDRRAYVYQLDTVIASYPIAVGKKGWETPTGTFQVMHKQHDPVWLHPITGKVFEAGPDSPLGDRWIGFWSDGRNEIGFHGTPDTNLLGSAISHGCVRMRNPDVRLLYEQVKLGTPVVVRD